MFDIEGFNNLIAIKNSDGTQFSYQEIKLMSKELGDRFYSDGRKLTCVVCDNSYLCLLEIFMLLLLKQPMLLLSSDADERHFSEVLSRFCPKYIWERSNGTYSYKAWSDYEIHEDLAILMSTSGTIGYPKYARLSYQNILNGAIIQSDYLSINEKDRSVMLLPVYHVYGLVFAIAHWISGGCVLTSENGHISNEFADFCSKERINNYASVPDLFRILRKTDFWNKINKEDIQNVVTGGDRIDLAEHEYLISSFREKYHVWYGQTETSSAILGYCAIEGEGDSSCIGKPMKDVKVSLAENGELIIRSKSVFMGYAKSVLDLSKGNENAELIQTGDICRMDSQGFIFISGRISRFIKLKGERISLDNIEALLREEISKSDELVCIDKEGKLFVLIRTDDGEPYYGSIKQLSYLIAQKLKLTRSQFCLGYIKTIPRTESGKVRYSLIGEDGWLADNLICKG